MVRSCVAGGIAELKGFRTREPAVGRRLSAILAADVVGYSRLMGEDEAGTLTAIKELLAELVDPKAAQYSGRIIKLMGDGILMEFASVVDAVHFAVDVQSGMTKRNADVPEPQQILFRIGINIGDVIVEDDDIYGDGVNVAARLEGMAQPGGVTISRNVRDQIRDKLQLNLEDLGEVEVKNIARPVRAFHITMDEMAATLGSPVIVKDRSEPTSSFRIRLATIVGVFVLLTGTALVLWSPWSPMVERALAERMKFPLPAKPSIAVLPFNNLSNDKGQDFFADGITDDIITDLSKISGIFVTARHSTVGYKGKTPKIRKIAEEFGVRYVLGGTVRRAGEKLRITAQLVDAIKGHNLWSERYDRKVQDVFAVQSEVTKSVVKAMAVTLKAREHDRVFQKYVKNIEAYDVWQQARAAVEVPAPENIERGETLFKRAIRLDPKFAGGYAGLSFNHAVKARFGYGSSRQDDVERALALAKKAIELDPEFAWSHIAMAGALLANREYDAAVDAMQKAVAIQPGGYETNLFMGFFLFRAERPKAAIRHLQVADKLGRVPTYRFLAFLGISYLMDTQYAKSEETWNKAIQLFGLVKHHGLYVFLAASQVALNKMEKATATVERFHRIRPEYRLSQSSSLKDFKTTKFSERIFGLATKAGFRE